MSEYEPDRRSDLDATRLLARIRDAALDSSCDAVEFEDRTAELRTLLAVELALAARRRNAVQSLQSRIPDELWCLVWQDLPLADRLSITRVCHTWRTIAHGAPSLWRFLDLVVDAHNSECDCQQCVDDIRKSRIAMQAQRPSKTNIHLAYHALKLGKQALVVLEVTDDTQFSNDDAYRFLGRVLSPHAHRIRAVYLQMVDNEIIDLLFDSIQSFPALRVLHMLCGDDPQSQNEFTSSPLSAPLLEELVISRSVLWDSAIPTGHMFARLHTLRCSICLAEEALRLLRVCPGLQCVRFDVDLTVVGEPGLAFVDLDEARLLAGRIPDVTLGGLKASIEAAYLDIFAISEIKSLSLWYYQNKSPSLRAVQNLASHCTGDSVTCACAAVGDYTAFKIDVGLSTHRLLMQSTKRHTLHRTWQALGAKIATELIVDFDLWPILFTGDNVEPMAQVTMFSVLLWKFDDVTAFLASESLLRLDLFPSLHGIPSREETAALEARAKDLTSLIDPLKVRRDGRPYLGFPMIEGVHGERDTTEAAMPEDSKRVSLIAVPLL
ncbi:hypothetical protein EXIGLDRAFT_745131 [Exidia glandulosa HHB12029]|uniref:F-box domain-containing protein n=1 Tax=Exidia glandulosa HHB12029 TaxID=1314781 RepID=A0A165NX03_EXIGL|nr:hypothetical protein EXIGLDRAFT_745131 [Exidia glandulosa HHB12029]